MVALSRLTLLAIATLSSAQSLSGSCSTGLTQLATNTFGGPRPTASPSPGDASSHPQELAGAPQAPRYPKTHSPSDASAGAARPTGKRSPHRRGKKHRSAAAAPTAGQEKRQARMTNGARLRSHKHKRPAKAEGAGVVSLNGARLTGARPAKTQRTGKPTELALAGIEKREAGGDGVSEASPCSTSSGAGATTRPTGVPSSASSSSGFVTKTTRMPLAMALL
jgi:hypothetical protein